MLSSSILLFSILFSMASATGHLRLELTASNDFSLQLRTNLNFKTIRMIMGNTRVTSFHPKTDDQPFLEVDFSKRGSSVFLRHVYEMRSPGEVTRQTFVLDEIVLLVSSKFECDAGFIGERCQEKSTSTSTTTTTLAPTTTIPTTSTVRVPPQRQDQDHHQSSTTNFFLCSTLVIVIIVLLILILIVFLAMRPRHQHIYIQQQQPDTPVKSYKIVLEDSGYQSSPESIRYTSSPTKFVTITL
uniref:SEA domain-containing protein n=1 Tax=Caenorhabditis tropicalis TaxID=1561998 RepID=A0A1I7TVH7_9PELO